MRTTVYSGQVVKYFFSFLWALHSVFTAVDSDILVWDILYNIINYDTRE